MVAVYRKSLDLGKDNYSFRRILAVPLVPTRGHGGAAGVRSTRRRRVPDSMVDQSEIFIATIQWHNFNEVE